LSIEITGRTTPNQATILTPEAIEFLTALHRKFDSRRRELLAARAERQKRVEAGELPDFLLETAAVRSGDWTVAPIPSNLLDRRVEITGPVDRKMVINALNCGANVFMADLEDANSPTWENQIEGQRNLADAVNGTISFASAEGKFYQLNAQTAVMFVRPRGWHLEEKHFLIDGEQISGSLFDFGLYFFHNAKRRVEQKSGPYFYLPKLESHLEARLWNDVFCFAQDCVGVPHGSIRATVLIETIFAAFEMHEILWELREHSAGLNCGRWDYIFSFIKKLGGLGERFVLPDRAQVTMDRDFLNAYVQLLIQTCHKRGIHAMGGMAAQIPIKSDTEANDRAIEKVRLDKLREVTAGHDGTWVAHPGLVPIAKKVFDEHMKTPNQIDLKRDDVAVTQTDLLRVHLGTITEAGVRLNADVGIRYLESWLMGNGCVPIHNLMEDAATAEICRAQLWQWIQHGSMLSDGRVITPVLAVAMMREEYGKIVGHMSPDQLANRRFSEAADLFEGMMTEARFSDFLTLEAYRHLA
jgi:malate synthase